VRGQREEDDKHHVGHDLGVHHEGLDGGGVEHDKHVP